MHVRIAGVFVVVISVAALGWYWVHDVNETRFSDTEVGFEEPHEGNSSLAEAVTGEADTDYELPELASISNVPLVPGSMGNRCAGWSRYWQEFSDEEEHLYRSWQRPPGPVRVGLQAGHWKVAEVPDELSGLRDSSGASGGGTTESNVVLAIAERTKSLLEAEGIVVDLLPATIPVDYSADAFVSIHADGNNSPAVSGFKISGPRRDFSNKVDDLVSALYQSYEEATGLKRDSNITRRMSGYYAFNWRRYDHAVHPMTPVAIVETGFITSPTDRAIIVSAPERAAQGIADGVLIFLAED